jgi:phage/plasmid-like protein (TIGR03299 family)
MSHEVETMFSGNRETPWHGLGNVVASGAAKYETAGSLKGGRVVFITMATPDWITLPGGDKIKTYLLLRTTHDGTGRIQVYVVTVRVVCNNTLTIAIGGAKHKWGVTHTSDVSAKVEQAQQALGLTIDYDKAFAVEAEQLMDVRVTDDQIVKFLKEEIEERPRRDVLIEKILFNVKNSPTVAGYEGTGWGVFNGVTEHLEHGENHRSGDAHFVRMFDGPQFKLRTNLANKILALA